jgi:hypothetical protein
MITESAAPDADSVRVIKHTAKKTAVVSNVIDPHTTLKARQHNHVYGADGEVADGNLLAVSNAYGVLAVGQPGGGAALYRLDDVQKAEDEAAGRESLGELETVVATPQPFVVLKPSSGSEELPAPQFITLSSDESLLAVAVLGNLYVFSIPRAVCTGGDGATEPLFFIRYANRLVLSASWSRPAVPSSSGGLDPLAKLLVVTATDSTTGAGSHLHVYSRAGELLAQSSSDSPSDVLYACWAPDDSQSSFVVCRYDGSVASGSYSASGSRNTVTFGKPLPASAGSSAAPIAIAAPPEEFGLGGSSQPPSPPFSGRRVPHFAHFLSPEELLVSWRGLSIEDANDGDHQANLAAVYRFQPGGAGWARQAGDPLGPITLLDPFNERLDVSKLQFGVATAAPSSAWNGLSFFHCNMSEEVALVGRASLSGSNDASIASRPEKWVVWRNPNDRFTRL